MFYEFNDEAVSISLDEFNKNIFTAGIINIRELNNYYKLFGFSTRAIENIKSEQIISTGVEEYEEYKTVTVYNNDTSFALFIKSKLVILVIIKDEKNILRDIFLNSVSKVNCESIDSQEFLGILFLELIKISKHKLNEINKRLEGIEEDILVKNTDISFNLELLQIKKELLELRNSFEEVTDICDSIDERTESSLRICISRSKRLKESTELLHQTAVQLWDCFQANTDMKLNKSMKALTLVTTIFFPVTIIVGWYGMNFNSMPETSWRFGYVYVIVLTALIITVVISIFKKQKWF